MMHTTNYYNTFIEMADDCPVAEGEVPPLKGETKSVANLQFEMIADNPYQYTSDEVIFGVHALRNGLTSNLTQERDALFSKGQACLRASPLPKRYGWGVHHNAEGKVAIYAAGTPEYEQFRTDPALRQVKAMRSKKA